MKRIIFLCTIITVLMLSAAAQARTCAPVVGCCGGEGDVACVWGCDSGLQLNAELIPKCTAYCGGHNEIACVDCHIPPGVTAELEKKYQAIAMVARYFTGTYGTRPWAEVEDYQSRIEEARTYLTEGRTLVHMVSPDKVQWITQRAQAIGLEVQREVLDDLDPTNRLLVLAAFWFYLLMTVSILVVYKRRLRSTGSER